MIPANVLAASLSGLLGVICALCPIEASAQTTEDMMSRYRALTSVAPRPCQQETEPDTIVVCASKLRESQKVPFVDAMRIGDRPLRAAGEPASFSERRPCGPRGDGCYDGPGIGRALTNLFENVRD